MKLLPKQETAVWFLKDQTTTELLYGGAAGGAKSSLGCLWLIENCQKYPGTRWLMGRAELKTLRETTLNTFFEWSSRLRINDQFSYNAKDYVINWTNGSQIILKDLAYYPRDSEYDRFGSLEITGAFIDECGQITSKAWQVIKSRIRYKLNEFGLHPKMLGTLNPCKNWTYKLFYKPYKERSLTPYRRFIQALPTDNPYLPASYLESLLQLDKNSRERLYYGNWEYDDDPATLIDQDAMGDYFNPVHIARGGDKYLTIDVARKGKDNTIFRVWEGFLCVERVAMPKSLVTETAAKGRELQAKHGIPNSRTIADEDGVGGGVVDIMGCKGFVNNSSPVGEKNYRSLKDQCSIRMAKAIQARRYGEICSEGTVKDLVAEEMEQVKIDNIDDDGKLSVIKKSDVKENIGRSPDDWDSIMMREYFELSAPGTVWLSTYNDDKHVTAEDLYKKNQIVYISVNFGADPITAILSHHISDNSRHGKLQYFSEMSGTVPEIVAKIAEACPFQHQHKLFILTGDTAATSGKTSVHRVGSSVWDSMLGALGLSWNNVTVPITKNDSESRELINTVFARHDGLLISRNCPRLIKDIQMVLAQPDGGILKTEQLPVMMDALRWDIHAHLHDFIRR